MYEKKYTHKKSRDSYTKSCSYLFIQSSYLIGFLLQQQYYCVMSIFVIMKYTTEINLKFIIIYKFVFK